VDKDTLTQTVQDYLENDETSFVSYIDQFIKLAEEDIYRQVQMKDLRKTSTSLSTTGSQKTGTIPTDFLAPYYFSITSSGSESVLLQKDPSFIEEVFSGAAEGLPRYYGIEDDATFVFGPTPDAAYTTELHYYYKPASLADGAGDGTTWLSTNAEQALLFGTLVQGYIYMKGDQDVIAHYKEKYTDAVAALKIIMEGRAAKDTNRRPNPRLPA
jgi:hypothetical protein